MKVKTTKPAKRQPWPAESIERRKVADLVPYARNARLHDKAQVAQIAASIKEWGWTNPVLVDGKGGVIAGHGRLLAAQQLGIEEIPCMVAKGWTKAQRQAYVIADNQLALDASWDRKLLKVELGELVDLDFDVGLIGFPDLDLKGLLQNGNVLSEPAKKSEGPVTQRGDIWKLGDHRIVCGECVDKDNVFFLRDVDAIIVRWQDRTGKKAKRSKDGKTFDALATAKAKT